MAQLQSPRRSQLVTLRRSEYRALLEAVDVLRQLQREVSSSEVHVAASNTTAPRSARDARRLA